jgi:CO/xanthine dehydrogenase Mo-binding subunit
MTTHKQDAIEDQSPPMNKRDISPRSYLAKATGVMEFSTDLVLPGMLYGKALRSPFPHCEIRSINIQPALEIPGVHAVITADDIPGENIIGKSIEDQEFLISRRARSIMDAIALVAAENKQIAERAVQAIELDLELLPAVFDPEEALLPDAPQLHEGGNLAFEFRIEHGDIVPAFEEADFVVEGTYTFPWIEHAFLETEGVVATPNEDGSLSIWLGCHNIYGEQTTLARAFGWSEDRFRVMLVPAGGSFGGKDDNLIGVWTALLAHHTSRPVLIAFDREESIRGHSKRHSQVVHYKQGFDPSGRILAADVKIISDTGAYAHWGTGIMRFASLQSTGPYKVPNARVHTKLVYTNNIVAGAMRGWGTPAVEFACEVQMDKAAFKLGMHPLQLRWINALRDGEETITGSTVPPGCYIRDTLRAAAEHSGIPLEEIR